MTWCRPSGAIQGFARWLASSGHAVARKYDADGDRMISLAELDAALADYDAEVTGKRARERE